jgi:hypothetical protein
MFEPMRPSPIIPICIASLLAPTQPAKTALFAGGNQGNVRRNHFL